MDEVAKMAIMANTGRPNIKLPSNIDLVAKVPLDIRPFGFYGNLLTEGAWLPVRNEEGKVERRPFLVVVKETGDVEVKDFEETEEIEGCHVGGIFPSATTETRLMQPDTLELLVEGKEIDPKETDRKLDEQLSRFAYFHDEIVRIMVKRWIEGTFFYDVFDHFPILFIYGVSESGKSRLLATTMYASYHGRQMMIDPTEAVIFRTKEEERCTIAIDEAEQFGNTKDPRSQMLQTLLNASYSKHSSVPRYDSVGDKKVRKEYGLYSPLVLDGTRQLGGITLSRCIMVVMYKVKRDYPEPKEEHFRSIRSQLYFQRLTRAFKLRQVYEEVDLDGKLSARYSELFRPIIALTRLFGNFEEEKRLLEFMREYESKMRLEAVNLNEEQELVAALEAEMGSETADWFHIKDIASRFNSMFSHEYKSRSISSVLDRIGFEKRKEDAKGTKVYLTKEGVDSVKERYGFTLPSGNSESEPPQGESPSSPLLPLSPQQEGTCEYCNRQKALEYKDIDGNLICAECKNDFDIPLPDTANGRPDG